MATRKTMVWVGVMSLAAVGAITIVAIQALLGRIGTPSCPAGWVTSNAPPIQGAELLRACTREGDSGPRAARVALYRTSEPATTFGDRGMRAIVAAALRSASGAGAEDPPTHAISADRRLSIDTRSIDVDQLRLDADVYLVAAGHRFGLLNIVHTPDAPFARPEATAAWMNTLEGVSPWGAPGAGPLRGHCPEGFESRPPEGERTVVRCVFGLGSSRFTLVSLTWDEGGLANDSDRARIATAIATRVAQAQGAEARVVEGPVAFTLARNVDAMHTRVQTGERVPVAVRAIAATANAGSRHVLGLGVSEPDTETVPVLSAMFVSSGATRPPTWLTRTQALAYAAGLIALGAVIAALLARRS